MNIRWGLLRFLWRQILPVTAAGWLALSLYVLLQTDVMTERDLWPGLIVLLHCLLLAVMLGRFETPAFAFVYSRGFGRDTLWVHMMLVTGLSVLSAWLSAGLIIWTGLRSMLHDRVFQSPYFPIMAPRETWMPLTWLVLYVLVLPACHYAWIRRAQCTKGRQGGNLVAAGFLFTLLTGFEMVHYLQGWVAWTCGILFVAAVAGLVAGGRLLHRSLEVRT